MIARLPRPCIRCDGSGLEPSGVELVVGLVAQDPEIEGRECTRCGGSGDERDGPHDDDGSDDE